MKCKHLNDDGDCWASVEVYGTENNDSLLKCPYKGNVRKCLDALIGMNLDDDTLWQDFVNTATTSEKRARCKHMCKDGTCLKSLTSYEVNGLSRANSIKCPNNGDVQECLDGLIYMNEYETTWKSYVASCMILEDEERQRKARLYEKQCEPRKNSKYKLQSKAAQPKVASKREGW